jgi:hypothetical protein
MRQEKQRVCIKHVGHVQLKDKALREGKVLPSHHPASASVLRVGSRIADKADDSFGGGFTSHMQVRPHLTTTFCVLYAYS